MMAPSFRGVRWWPVLIPGLVWLYPLIPHTQIDAIPFGFAARLRISLRNHHHRQTQAARIKQRFSGFNH